MEIKLSTYAKNDTLPIMAKSLLSKLPYDDFDKDCAYWLSEYLDDMGYQQPPNTPQEVISYQERRKTDHGYHLSNSFWHQQHIKDWSKQLSEVSCANHSNKYWLEFMRKHIPEDDLLNQSRITELLNKWGI